MPRNYADLPADALESLDAWRTFNKKMIFPGVSDERLSEAYIRELVVVNPDGSVRKRESSDVEEAEFKTMLTDTRDYSKVRCPILAIYSESLVDLQNTDPARAPETLAWEEKSMSPWRTASMEQLRRERPNAEIVRVPGAHADFLLTSREHVVAAMRRFFCAVLPEQ